MPAYETERVAKTDGTYEVLTSIVEDACVFRINNQSNVHQTVSVEKFSTLIDQGQAMFNLSAFLGLTHFDEKDNVVMLLHFTESEGSLEIKKSARSQFFLFAMLFVSNVLFDFQWTSQALQSLQLTLYLA